MKKFKLKSGNTTPFKKMGSSPVKQGAWWKTTGVKGDPEDLDKKGKPKKKAVSAMGAGQQFWKTGLGFIATLGLAGLAGDKITKMRGPSKLMRGMPNYGNRPGEK